MQKKSRKYHDFGRKNCGKSGRWFLRHIGFGRNLQVYYINRTILQTCFCIVREVRLFNMHKKIA